MDPLAMDPPTMDERLKNAAIRGDVGFLREAIASGKPFEYFKLEYFPRVGTDANEVGGNMFYLAAINERVEFIREALEVLPFSIVDELLKQRGDIGETPCVEDLLLQDNEYDEVLVRVIEDFYERRNPMDRHLKNAAIQGDVEFLKQAVASDKPLEYFKSIYFPCPTWQDQQGGNIFHLAAYHGRVEFFKDAMKILPISEAELDSLLWQPHNDKYGICVLDVARDRCREIVEVMEEIYRGRSSMDEQLKKAAIQGDIVFLREAIASNKPNSYFQSLHYCVPDPDYWEGRVGNIFHLAAWNRRAEFVREAMEILPKAAGVDVHFLLGQQDHPKFKRNPLHVAAEQGYNKIVKVILDYYDRHHKSLLSAPANSLPQPTKAMAMAMDCRSVKPWLGKDRLGYTPFYRVMDRCREECALKLLSIDPELFSHMDDCAAYNAHYSIFVIALQKGFSKVILKFWESAPNWQTFDKRVLACALGVAPNCSDEIFRLVFEQIQLVIKDRDYYRIWSPLASWAFIGKLYPFEHVLKEEEVCATDPRRYVVDMISEENPLYYLALSDCDEDRAVQIATILVDAWNKQIEQLNAGKVEPPWFARRITARGTVLGIAIEKRREKFAVHFLSLEKIELFLREGDKFLFEAIDRKCHDVAQRILDLVYQHGLKTLLTSNVGRTVLHDAPKCKEDFLKQLVKRYPELMEQTDDDGVTVLHSWMEIGELWAFQCVLNEDEFSLNVRKKFAALLWKKTDDNSWNPLHVAAAVGANGVIGHIVRFVLEAIPERDLYFYQSAIEDRDVEGNTPVDIALSTRREELALCFLSNHIRPWDNYLFKAIDNQCHSVVKFILGVVHRHRWPLDCLRMEKQNVLHIASKCTGKNAKLIIKWWPELINEQDANGKTPLQRASEAGANWLLKLILQKERSSILKAPMIWVEPCERGDLSTILAFAENTYFRYICREHKDTPLHHVKFKGYSKYQELLKCEFIRELKNARDTHGDTPLHRAIKHGNKDLTEILFNMGDVEWNIKNKDGKTAMDLLKEEASKDSEWSKFCDAIGVNPRLKITYIQSRRDVTQMRETISLVAALLATITFTAGFTLPGGFNSDSGDAILTKKAAFLVFLIADTYAMCCSMLILFGIIWSMVCDSKRSSFLADRSLGLLKHSLYGTFLAFMTGVYTVTYKKSLWIAIVVIVMCSLAVILAQRRILYKLFEVTSYVTEKAHRMQMQLPSSWKRWTSYIKSVFRGKQRGMASNNQGQDEEAAPFTNQGEHQEITTPANITNIKLRSQQLLMTDQSEHKEAEPLGEQSESKLDSIVWIKEQYG